MPVPRKVSRRSRRDLRSARAEATARAMGTALERKRAAILFARHGDAFEAAKVATTARESPPDLEELAAIADVIATDQYAEVRACGNRFLAAEASTLFGLQLLHAQECAPLVQPNYAVRAAEGAQKIVEGLGGDLTAYANVLIDVGDLFDDDEEAA